MYDYLLVTAEQKQTLISASESVVTRLRTMKGGVGGSTGAAEGSMMALQRDQALSKAVESLVTNIGIDAAAKIKHHVQDHMRSHIVVPDTLMNDGSPTYTDTWGDATSGVWGYGAVTGTVNVHNYAVNVTVTSPKGRVASATGDYNACCEDVSNQINLAWDTTDLGQYRVRGTFRGWCMVGNVSFPLDFKDILSLISLRVTYFTNPQYMGFGACAWPDLACSAGTTATCKFGVTFKPYTQAQCLAMTYISAQFLGFTELGQSPVCFSVF